MNHFPSFRAVFTRTLLVLATAATVRAGVSDLLFTVRIGGTPAKPTIYVTNDSPTLEITRFEMTIGDLTRNFDASKVTVTDPPNGHATQNLPDGSFGWFWGWGARSGVLQVDLTDFGPGKTFSVEAYLNRNDYPPLFFGYDPALDFKTVFFNNGNLPNSVVTVYSGPVSASRTLPETPTADSNDSGSFTFRGPGRMLHVVSKTETENEFVRGIVIKRNGQIISQDETDVNVEVAHGDSIQITAPQEVYKDINSQYITSSGANAADLIKNTAEERFVATGMSVNNIAQTADPTNYSFEITGDTEVQVNWQHYYALTIRHDFSKAQSQEVIAGTPWAGPLASDAAGNPDPPVSKQWVLRGNQPVVQVDGQYVDNFSHPGLDLRYVVNGYQAYGPPNSLVNGNLNDARLMANGGVDIRKSQGGAISSYSGDSSTTVVRVTADGQFPSGMKVNDQIEITGCSYAAYNGIHAITAIDTTSFSISVPVSNDTPNAKGMWKNVTYVRMINFPTVEQRQQVQPSFSMYGPGGITYVWQIQYGVHLSADDGTRTPLTKVYEVTDTHSNVDRTVQDGVAWFDPGTHIKVVTAPREAGPDGMSLTGWVNGDGYYFASQGQVDPATGLITSGAPAAINGSPVATWITNGPNNSQGYEIFNLQRPVRTMWRYGAGAIVVNVVIGKHCFEDYPQYAAMFVRQPDPIINAVPDPIATVNGGVAPGAELMAEWDPVSGRLYPTIPGIFTVPWKPGSTATKPVEVRVVATLPYDGKRGIRGHYPHINGTPGVAVDPDPNDDFAFKSIKFSTAGAAVDANKLFTTDHPGFSVLLFAQLQRVGRGQPRQFLQVRVVDTRNWNANLLATPETKWVGQKIVDPAADLAKLGTGYVLDLKGRARYNPFIYDGTKMEGLAAKDIYDMTLLRADKSSLVVVNKKLLPGPVIPVNEHPGVPDNELPIIVWYDDPRSNDSLMWPYVARIYKPVWPNASTLPQIVIASQLGSDGKSPDNQDQPTAPAIGSDAPATTTYDPARLQNVLIYQQPDFNAPGYNPNEEHALVAPSLRFADVSPRPPAIYALRDGDLNYSDNLVTDGFTRYTSKPCVLVQFYDVADDEIKMNLYQVKRESLTGDNPRYHFATSFAQDKTILKGQPYVTMRAGDPVIPFYPLGVVIGASPAAETYGNNLFKQEAYWEDWRGSSWAISGGDYAWFTVSFYYPMAPDFWWPPTVSTPPVKVTKSGAVYMATYDSSRNPQVPGTGDAVAFLPVAVKSPADANDLPQHLPTPVIYKSEWPDNPAILKAGETLTFSGGEYHADHPTGTLVKNGVAQTVETPGLPQVVAFASAEVVFDSLNPEGVLENLESKWTARMMQVLDKRTAPLASTSFPADLQPASGNTTVKAGKYVFNGLSASLQRRLRYDPLAVRLAADGITQVPGVLEFSGLLNDKAIGDATLTASPPQVYVLEPNILTAIERDAIIALVPLGTPARSAWENAVWALYTATRNPDNAPGTAGGYLAGLMQTPKFGPDGQILKDNLGNVQYVTPATAHPLRAYGPGLALVPNGGFLDPLGKLADGSPYPDESWVTVVENNDPTLGGSPITPHIVKVDRHYRYRGAVKTILSDNVFDENIVLRSTGDFGANADDLIFEWWYRPDDGSEVMTPPDLIPAGQSNPWKLFPDPSGNAGRGRYQITLKGNPNAPETLLADTWWYVRYRHRNDVASGTNWAATQPNGRKGVNFTWAGAGNSDPFHDYDLNGVPDYRPQLAMGWIKRVLDAVNPYEARISDFTGDNPSTVSSMVAEFGARYEGPVALNPAKNVIENVGLIELYQTVLNRGKNLSIDLSQPVSTPAISNALQLASTRISDFYMLLGNEAYVDALDPTIGVGSDSVDPGNVSTSVHAFQNQTASMMEEELDLLRGVDDSYARPVYNRLFWNFTKGEGEAAYATNYNITDVNKDGFINEDDAMLMFPQGHGDAWGHYLTALCGQYDLLRHPYFNWVSRSESYNLQDIVISVDFFDERKFATAAAAKAKAGADIVALTYRDKYVADPNAQWQGYTDSNPDRAWGVDEWARRAGQGAYFDWVTANALLPSQHPNTTLDGVRKVDRQSNSDIAVVSANLSAIQRTMDQADHGYNPLGLIAGAQVFDLEPAFINDSSGGDRRSHFDQIFRRAEGMVDNVTAVWDMANQSSQMLRKVGNSEADFRNSTFQEDLSYRNQLITIFGKPYEGTVGPGKLYPAGYEGPDLGLYMYVAVRQVNNSTVPGPAASFASFDASGNLTSGTLYDAYSASSPSGSGSSILGFETSLSGVSSSIRDLFAPTFGSATNLLTYTSDTKSGLFDVNYTDLTNPKVNLTNFINQMPITAAGYTFQAPLSWGTRKATGELQDLINQMIQQEAAVATAVGDYDSFTGETVRILRLLNARLTTTGRDLGRDEVLNRIKAYTNDLIKIIETSIDIYQKATELTWKLDEATVEGVPLNLPTGGVAVSPGDALSLARSGIDFTATGVATGFMASGGLVKAIKLIAETALDVAETENTLSKAEEDRMLQIKEWVKELQDKISDEPMKRIAIFKEMQSLRQLSDQYRSKLDEGGRLVDQRAAFNKQVAAQTQRNRYQDMTFRVSRNHMLQTYRDSFDLASRYAYLAATAYDYETNFSVTDPASPADAFSAIIRARTIYDLTQALTKLNANHEVLRAQLGLNNEQRETGAISYRRECLRILGTGQVQPNAPANQFPAPGQDSDTLWKQALQKARVPDLWQVPEFRQNCRPFAAATDTAGNPVPQPGIVLRFASDISSGKNFFGKSLSGGDQAYSTSHYATKIFSTGVTFDGYKSDDIQQDLATAPRVFFIPAGMDVMRVSRTDDPNELRKWKVVEQAIPVPFPATNAMINQSGYIPLLDGLDGHYGDQRKFSDFRAYPDTSDVPTVDTRLLGRSIWNTQWMLIIPGATLSADPDVGLDRFIDQVSDIKFIFDSYGQSGG